jgi:hypothetical protein
VAPQWIVTSTACFAEDGKPVTAGAPPRATTVSIGHGTTAAKATTATSLVPHADPIAASTTAPTDGEVLRAAGYGPTTTEWVPDKLHAATFEVTAVRAGALDLTRQDAMAGICRGDAGGPLPRETEGRVELVSIHHAAGQKGCLGSPDTAQDAVETRRRAEIRRRVAIRLASGRTHSF